MGKWQRRTIADLRKSESFGINPAIFDFMKQQPDFYGALKMSSDRFRLIRPVILPPLEIKHPKHGDQVIGMFHVDFGARFCRTHGAVCLFKQDFIVDLGHLHWEFVAYTRSKGTQPDTQYVKSIDTFEKDYGLQGKHFGIPGRLDHHYSQIEQLPSVCRANASELAGEFGR